MTELHLLFYQAALQQIVNINNFMQLENPLVPILHDLLHDFLKKLSCRFLDVRKVKEVGPALINYNEDSARVTDAKLGIGFSTRVKLNILIEEGHDPNAISNFYDGAHSFYKKALQYARDNLPLNDPLFMNARFLNFAKRESAEFSQLEYFIDRFSALLPDKSDPVEMEKLKEELISYQLQEETDLPATVWEKAIVYQDSSCGESTLHSMDITWMYLAGRATVDGNRQFAHLSRVACLVLTIPHTNPAEERIFSMVRKNKTPFRPNLDPEETLGSMALPKEIPPYEFEPPKELIVAAKKATGEYNLAYSSRY